MSHDIYKKIIDLDRWNIWSFHWKWIAI